jgi:hypothetical protein
MNKHMIAEVNDVKLFSVEEVGYGQQARVKIKGLVFHSSIAVESVKIRRIGNSAQVLLELTPARPELSGSFTIVVPADSDLDRILFGHSATEIWHQKSQVNQAGQRLPA